MILNSSNPNIILILMESVSADCMVSLNGIKGLMPCLDSLTKESLLFINFYANGFLTEQGIIAFLSSFHAQPQTS
ncbi:MAG: sulfatase-like hydrolase/transferase [Bacteroidetes bacterium]|nr:sulfatase-like hydrolase/transferase [Bacteroidota bacterium]